MSPVKTETTEREIDRETFHAAELVTGAANVIKPALSKHVGSFVCHVYQFGLKLETAQFAFATQMIGKVPEQLAVEAAKELKVQMMERYGHKTKNR
jgi:hypothetical protein